MKPLIDSAAIIKRLGVSRRTFQRMVVNDQTFPIRWIGGKWRADPDELEDWIKNQPTTLAQKREMEREQPTAKPRRGRPPLSGTFPRSVAK